MPGDVGLCDTAGIPSPSIMTKIARSSSSEESWYAATPYFLVFTVSCFQSTTCATSLVSSRISLKTFLFKVPPCLTLGGLKGEPIVLWGRGISERPPLFALISAECIHNRSLHQACMCWSALGCLIFDRELDSVLSDIPFNIIYLFCYYYYCSFGFVMLINTTWLDLTSFQSATILCEKKYFHISLVHPNFSSFRSAPTYT